MTTDEKVRNRILSLCRERIITLNKLATISNITQSTLNDFINGKTTTTTISTINKICSGLNISLYEFFNDEMFRVSWKEAAEKLLNNIFQQPHQYAILSML